MLSLKVQVVCLFLYLYSVSGLPVCGEFDKEQFFVSSDVLPFQDEFEELFRNFNESESGQIERISQLLQNINPFVSNNLDNIADKGNKNENRINFVVSQRHKIEKIKVNVNITNTYLHHLLQPDRIKSSGYPVEDHEIVTDDGYILNLFRIPHGIKSPQTKQKRPPVLLMHGLFDSSNCYIVLGSDNSLGIFDMNEFIHGCLNHLTHHT